MSRSAKVRRFAVLLAVLAPAAAAAGEPERPVANRTPDASDVAMTPINDLNLRRDAIPPLLIAAANDPYASGDIAGCADVGRSIAALDAVLGPDMDVADRRTERISAGVVAKSVVASFIPFRGILREVSGAADHQRQFEAAIYAGAVRRGFLKGLGQQMKCDYPARPAFTRVVVADPAPATKAGRPANTSSPTFVEQPIVQDVKKLR